MIERIRTFQNWYQSKHVILTLQFSLQKYPFFFLYRTKNISKLKFSDSVWHIKICRTESGNTIRLCERDKTSKVTMPFIRLNIFHHLRVICVLHSLSEIFIHEGLFWILLANVAFNFCSFFYLVLCKQLTTFHSHEIE